MAVINYISIHALREEGDQRPGHSSGAAHWISIHALREEGDAGQLHRVGQRRISIHALREEGDRAFHRLPGDQRDFYPRPPRGGRRGDCGKATTLK